MILGIAYTSLLTAELAAHLSRRDSNRSEDDVRAKIDALTTEVRALRDEIAGRRDDSRST